jgi:hypothetical protein
MVERRFMHLIGASYLLVWTEGSESWRLLAFVFNRRAPLFAVSGSAILPLSALEHPFPVNVLGNFLLFWVALGALSGYPV